MSPNAPSDPKPLTQWRSVEELRAASERLHVLEPEFPDQADIWPEDLGRRRFLQVMGASAALAGVSGCIMQPEEKIVPYVRAPEQVVPGRPLYFATASIVGGYGTGALVESHMGRPTKVEGNPTHPGSLGATDIFAQASVLSLYDPDRSQVVTFNGRVNTWERFLSMLIDLRPSLLKDGGARLRILTGTITSPTEARLLSRVLQVYPQARWHVHDPVGEENTRRGALQAFNTDVSTVHDLEKADVVLSIDSDFLCEGPAALRAARQFAARREPGQPPNRLYAVETCPSVTGAAADHRWPLTAREIHGFVGALARAVGVEGARSERPYAAPWFSPLVRDLVSHKGRSVIVAGENQPPWVHALVHAMNQALGNVGQTVNYIEPIAVRPPEERGGNISSLVRDMAAGQVDALVVLGCNPVYDAPVDLNFGRHYVNLPLRLHLGLYNDETAALSTWHVPQAHALESWGDVRGFDGTATIVQPLIAPLYGGRTASEVLSALADGAPPSSRRLVEETWRGDRADAEFAEFWAKTLSDGVVQGSASAPKQVLLQPYDDRGAQVIAGDSLELHFRPDPTIRAGEFANNGWLQELPKPLTKLTWDNAAQLGPETANQFNIGDGDLVDLTYRERTLRAAAFITPGHAEGAVTLTLGYGRTKAGTVGTKTPEYGGFNAYLLRTSDDPWVGPMLTIAKATGTYTLATTQVHWTMPNPDVEEQARHLILVESHSDYERDRREGRHSHEQEETEPPAALTIYEHPAPMQRRIDGEGNRWGMAINLSACIGCNACVVACQAENNIPVVGKDQVVRGREMHWLRIDRYYSTSKDSEAPAANPQTLLQPVLCMHCENAPCEIVCPVGATTHSAEGLNEMTYNRCVGTRYCSNNCPYKVRRFNFFQYTKSDVPSLKLLYNPDVTVRTRGVMEKCTYCVQRINAARIESEIAGEPRVAGNAVVTACQQSCPTRAIVFGNLNDPESDVAALSNDPRHYNLLGELNTRPRTVYLKKLTNPNPAIEA